MQFELEAVSPVDGRYGSKTRELSDYFSEYALFKYRVHVEVEYFIALSTAGLNGFPELDDFQQAKLRDIYEQFSISDAEKIKSFEKVTNHDVKSVEYFLKECLEDLNLSAYKEWVHFGLTSQDINNTAVPMSLRDAVHKVMIPKVKSLIQQLHDLANQWKEISLLARTHGQPASPTTVGKEFQVFVVRLERQLEAIEQTAISGKFGGATGSLNAHKVALPEVDWLKFANEFVENKLGIKRQPITTQIEHYDDMAALFDAWKRLNNIVKDLCQDVWLYISQDYFKQKIVKGEVGSSAMPHKVNPIDFENAEGNVGLANALFSFLAEKLPVSRLQRDLTDSTVSRNIGVPFAHSLIALKSVEKGLNKLLINEEVIAADLENNWAVVAEAVQNILRAEGIPNPYEQLKALTRTNEKVNQESLHAFIDELEVDATIKTKLKSITPSNYIGYAAE